MKPQRKMILIFSLFLIVWSGCSSNSQPALDEAEEKFQNVVPLADMNKSLDIKVDGDRKTFHLGSDIPILVENKSSHYLIFNLGDNYIKLFIYRDSKWVEVKSQLTYSGSRIMSPSGTLLLDQNYTWAQPVLDDEIFKDNKTDVLLRIVMTGEIIENDKPTGRMVGAYVDAYLTP